MSTYTHILFSYQSRIINIVKNHNKRIKNQTALKYLKKVFYLALKSNREYGWVKYGNRSYDIFQMFYLISKCKD